MTDSPVNAEQKRLNTLLVISTLPTHPQDEGANRRVFAMMEVLREHGLDVHFAFIPRNRADVEAMRDYWGDRFHLLEYIDPVPAPMKFLLRVKSRLRIKHNYRIDDWFDSALLASVATLRDTIRPDAVLVEYVYMSRVLELFGTDCLKVIDTHDVMTERQARSIAQGQPARWFSTTAAEEGRGLARADLALAIQERECKFLQSITTARVATVGHVTPVEALWSFVKGRTDLLYVGTNNPSNVQAIQSFMQLVMPRLLAQRPAVRLHVVGKVCSALQPSEGVELHGVVPDINIFYSKVSLSINPVLFGTGLKIKNIEAMSFGCPLLTTPVGAEGVEAWSGVAFQVESNLDSMADSILALLDNESRLTEYSRQGMQLVKQMNTESTAVLLDALVGTSAVGEPSAQAIAG